MEKLAALKPLKQRSPASASPRANSPGLNDGAAVVVVASDQFASSPARMGCGRWR
jgi:hypothetical protein